MPSRFSIYSPPGRLALPNNPFGKDVANLELFRALAQHGGFEQLDLLSLKPPSDEEARVDLLGEASGPTQIRSHAIFDQRAAAASGILLRGTPEMDQLAWMRRRAAGDGAYSLVGLVHTLGPPFIRSQITDALTAPVQPWDALICTSPSVEAIVRRWLEDTGDWLAERTGGRPPPLPQLPVIPLGVDAAGLAALRDRPLARAKVRAELAVGADDILVLWVGRLSFFEKAFPQAMFRAVRQAAERSEARICFAMAGWFPRQEDRALYEDAARALAPGVDVRLLDGNDKGLLGELWAGADVFLSLVDNIQETFGITPVEAMAAGLPVVVSDWDGYRATVQDGVEGFRVPTLGGPANGLGAGMTARHALGLDTYQTYVGAVAQHTAVHVGRCAEALTRLIGQPELRRTMGEAGRARVRSTFDWPVVVRQIAALADDLARLRGKASAPPPKVLQDPVRGDPFRDFAGFASLASHLDLPLALAAGASRQAFEETAEVRLDNLFSRWRASREECARILDLIASGRARTVREVLIAFPQQRRRAVDLALVWLAKLGFVEWLA